MRTYHKKPLPEQNMAAILGNPDYDLGWKPQKRAMPNPYLLERAVEAGIPFAKAMEAATGNDYHGMFRSDTGAQIGAVKSRYEPVDHARSFEILDALVSNETGAFFTKAGTLRGGAQVFADVVIPAHSINVLGVGDVIESFVSFTSTHDGSGNQVWQCGLHRLVCANGMRVVENGQSLKGKHTKTIHGKMDAWEKILLQTSASFATIGDKLNMLASKSMTSALLTEFRLAQFGDSGTNKDGSKRINGLQDEFDAIYELNDANEFPTMRGTLYNALQAMTNQTSHSLTEALKPRYDDSSQMFGTGFKRNAQAFDWLLTNAKHAPVHTESALKVYSIPEATVAPVNIAPALESWQDEQMD